MNARSSLLRSPFRRPLTAAMLVLASASCTGASTGGPDVDDGAADDARRADGHGLDATRDGDGDGGAVDAAAPRTDSSRGADSIAHPEDGAPPTARCTSAGGSEWTTYGHDAQRTFASDGCALGPLTVAWTFKPDGAGGGKQASIDLAIATRAAIYLKSTNHEDLGGKVAAQVNKVTPSGKGDWQFAFGDFEEHNWPTFAFGILAVQEDTFWFVNDADGTGQQLGEYDDWGCNAADDTRWYASCDVNSRDGYGIYVGSYPAHPTSPPEWPPMQWSQNLAGGNKGGGGCGYEIDNSIAVEKGVVFHAGEYVVGSAGGTAPFPSGIAAYDGGSGAVKWSKETSPRSALSVGGGKVFLVEKATPLALVARDASDGHVVWSTSIAAGASIQAPVLAHGLAIVALTEGVRAFHVDSGAVAWTAGGIDAVQAPFVSDPAIALDPCGGVDKTGTLSDTALAAALGSDTLVVTAKDAVHVLSLVDGAPLESAKIAGVTGPMKNPVIVGKTVYAIDTGAAGGVGQLVALTSH